MGKLNMRIPATASDELVVYRTSDNTIYKVHPDRDISEIIKHCQENNITLFDSEGKEVTTKKKKK